MSAFTLRTTGFDDGDGSGDVAHLEDGECRNGRRGGQRQDGVAETHITSAERKWHVKQVSAGFSRFRKVNELQETSRSPHCQKAQKSKYGDQSSVDDTESQVIDFCR